MKINIRKSLSFYKGVKYDKAYKMKLLRLYLRLINTKGLGAKRIKKLITHIGSIENFSEESSLEVLGERLTKAVSEVLKRKSHGEDEVLEILKKYNIRVLLLENDHYPRKLKSVDDPPPILFYKGEIPKEGIAIVGTRNPSKLSLEVVGRLIEEKGKNIISGGARGIDLKAHTEALKQGFRTFVILGAGILNIPPGVKKLLENHKGKVSLISEFLPLQKANRYTFPRRNRIIAALSDEVYIIEAGNRSGSLITADYAVKYGKPLYAFVGNDFSERWKGCLDLIKRGLAKQYNPKQQTKEKALLNFLKKPRTYDEVMVFLGLNQTQTISILSKFMIRGLIKKEGAYYISL